VLTLMYDWYMYAYAERYDDLGYGTVVEEDMVMSGIEITSDVLDLQRLFNGHKLHTELAMLLT